MKNKLAFKLILSVGLAVLPAVGLLSILMVEMSSSTNFTTKEIQGLEYIKSIKKLLQNLPEHKLHSQKYLLGNSNIKKDMLKNQKDIDDCLNEISLVNEKNYLDQVISDRIINLKKDWLSIKNDSLKTTAEKSSNQHNNILKNLKKFIVSIGDSSNLIRDPEMASFYLIDATMVKLTSKINISDSVIEISDKILTDSSLSSSQKNDANDLENLLGDDKAKSTKKSSVDLDDKANLSILLGLLNSISDDLRDSYTKAFVNNPEIKGDLEKILTNEEKITDNFIEFLGNTIIKQSKEINSNKIEKLGQEVLNVNFDLWEKTVSNIEKLLNQRVSSFNQRKYLISFLSILISILSILIGIYIVKNIVNSIRKLEETAKKVSEGNLDTKVYISSNDEIGSLSQSFNNMIDSIKNANLKLKDGTVSIDMLEEKIDSLNRLTEEIKKSKEESERNSINLESLIKETSSSIYEIKQTSDLVADNARIVSEAAELSVHISSDGRKAVKDSIKSVDKIKTQIEAIAEKILELSKQTQAIGEIISTVDDISKQSRLLAFNATIEATKANEYGKGFTVVAAEIKAMAEESREATKRISSILNQIQHFTNTIVMLTEDGMKLADIGVDLSKVAGDSIDKLIDSINNSSEVASQISVSSLEQRTGMEQLEESMKNIAFRSL